MTTNKERAAEVMRGFWKDGRYAVSFDEIVRALAEAGLLAPDLPRPDFDTEGGSTWWKTPSDERPGAISTVLVDEGEIWDDGELVTPDTARKKARALLAAAAYAEKENNHDHE